MQRGYVKVWRKLEESGLLQMPNTLALFMYLLMKAAWEDRKVGTPTGVIELKRGQFISGRIKLAETLEQSEQQIRTGLERLVDMEIITSTATNRYTIYTIVNYDNYQDSKEQVTSTATNRQPAAQPTDNQQITTKEELKKLKETYIPENFSISERVLTWASKNGHRNLDQHLEHFVGVSTAKGYKYADWDAAFMNAIRQNWAKVTSSQLRVAL